MTRSVLVTGGFGFLGRAVAARFRESGYQVTGLGNGRWTRDESAAQGFDEWLGAGLSMSSLMKLRKTFDVIAHCAGNGSVAYAHSNPRQDFSKTVGITADVLEFIRVKAPSARLVYPSSAGVYGAQDDTPIRETDRLNPISVYGYHKRVVEELCEISSRNYGLRVSLVRFFSIYGAGLTKQLLWDASVKLVSGGTATFSGTGRETRDWIHVTDAARLMWTVAENPDSMLIVNGATGLRVTVREVLEQLKMALGVTTKIEFNGEERSGDPRFYHANVARLHDLGFTPRVTLEAGLREYAAWFRRTWSR